jgi:hypothetical protein
MSFPSNPLDLQIASVNYIYYQYSTSTQAWRRLLVGASPVQQFLTISGSNNAYSTTTGALVVAGGVGIGQDVWVGGGLYTLSTLSSTSSVAGNSVQLAGGLGVAGPIYAGNIYTNGQLLSNVISGLASGTTSTFVISNTTVSTSTTSGALVVAGGVGIGQNMIIGSTATNNSTNSGALVVYGGAGFGGNVTIGGILTAGGLPKSTTTATNPPTNAFVGDIWYNPSTDVMYRYDFDGVNNYWVDVTSDAVTNTYIGGNINNNIVPVLNSTYNIGSTSSQFNTVYTVNLNVNGFPFSFTSGTGLTVGGLPVTNKYMGIQLTFS